MHKNDFIRKRILFCIGVVLGIVAIFFGQSLAAGNGSDAKKTAAKTIEESEQLDGFGDESLNDESDPFLQIDSQVSSEDQAQIADSPFVIGGFIKLESEYGFNKENEKVSKLMPIIFLETEYKINENYRVKASGQAFWDVSYKIEAKDDISGESLDDDEKSIELKDLYIDGKLGQIFSIRMGRQIVAWGESDYARITDVVNPRDLTQPGLIDLEDARLSTTALRLSGVFEAWSFDLVTVHEHPGSKISGSSSDFDYYIQLRNPGIIINDKHTPDFGVEDTAFAMKTTYAFNGGDISFVAANTYDDQPVLIYNGVEGSKMVFTPEYERVTTLGISATLAKGSTLFKVESSYKKDKKTMRNDFLSQIASGVNTSSVKTVGETDEILVLGGLDYTGWSDLRLTFEAQLSHILNYQDYLARDENEITTYFQATKDLYNETVTLDLFWIYLHPGHGNILRLSAGYDVFDDLNVQAGVVFYDSQKATSDLDPYKDRDRIFIRIKYSF